jgi:hypothetical protein
MELQIRKAVVEDIPKIVELFNAYTAPPKSEYFFHWWNSLPSVTFCAVYGGEIVGMFVVLRRKLINNLNCGVLMGLIVKKEWRGGKIFKVLGDKAMGYYDDMVLFCCLTNASGKKALEKNLDFSTIASIETMFMASDSRSKVDTKCQSSVWSPVAPDTKFDHSKIERDEVIMFLADQYFRQWRFAQHPRHSYQMMHIDSNEFIISNKYYDDESKLRYGDIVDFETPSLEEDRLVDLLSCAYLTLRKDVDMVTIQAVPDSLLHAAVKRIGFVESNIRHFFCINVKDIKNDYLYEPSNWLIKWGDYLR